MNSSYKLEFYSEPLLEFAHSQKSDYCKDGLFLYGPLKNKVEISYGVIGHEEGIKRFEKWISEINSYISSADSKKLHFSSFPGFKSIFNTKLKPIDNAKIYVDKNTILNKIKQDNINKAIYETVNLYREKLIHYKNNEEELPNIWFVIIPEEVHHYGRSKSVVPKNERIKSNVLYTKKMKLSDTPGQVKFFPEMNEQAKVYDYGTDFRRQLKLYRLDGNRPIVRGTAFKVSNNKAYLWTSGYVERFNTYPGFSVPNPITIEICRGDEELDTVIKDIFALTKINFNSCAFGDSVPVTLKFADVVGNILTAAPNEDVPPLPFIYYI